MIKVDNIHNVNENRLQNQCFKTLENKNQVFSSIAIMIMFTYILVKIF